jgi:hypothetical protein
VENCAAVLFRPSIMIAVLDVIMENVPELTALDLSHSNLSALDSLIVLAVRKFVTQDPSHSEKPGEFLYSEWSLLDHFSVCYMFFCFVLKHCTAGFCFLFS